jgi:hypothetical protein
MARTGIPGRAAPRRKHERAPSGSAPARGPQAKSKSRLSSSSAAAGSSSSATPAAGSAEAAVSKAAKRAVMRQALLAAPTVAAADVAPGKGDTVSRSALRRRKRQARDAIGQDAAAGREGGVKDVAEALLHVEEEMEEEEDARQEEPLGVGAKSAATISTNMRKATL